MRNVPFVELVITHLMDESEDIPAEDDNYNGKKSKLRVLAKQMEDFTKSKDQRTPGTASYARAVLDWTFKFKYCDFKLDWESANALVGVS